MTIMIIILQIFFQRQKIYLHFSITEENHWLLYHRWPTGPFKGYLGALSGPVNPGQDPSTTVAQETANWMRRLARQAKLGEDVPGVSVRRAEFLSVHGGGRNAADPLTGQELDMGITLCYVLPTTTRGICDRFISTSKYCHSLLPSRDSLRWYPLN